MTVIDQQPPIRSPFFQEDGTTLSWQWARWFQTLVAPASQVRNISSAYTAQPGDIILADTTTAGFTITLPPASKSYDVIVMAMKISADANTLTIDGHGADTINGAATGTTATQYGNFTLICNGVSAWFKF